ncbi:MAG: hypothetical protein SPJ27_07710 [Candidatus Onthovivens sp.]|nr:hypothetical protein [Candidatus Onthovivens sp.]
MKHIGLKEFKKLNNKEKQRLIKKFYKALKVDLLTTEEIYNKLNITGKLFGYIRDTYNIKCSKKEKQQKMERKFLEKYGVKNPYQSKEIQNKIIEQNLKQYGVKYNTQRSDMIKKTKETKLKRHGDSNYNNREKLKQTCLERYGVEHPNQTQMPNEIYNILHDKNLLESKILSLNEKDRTLINLKNLLNYNVSTIGIYVKLHGLDSLINYSNVKSDSENKIINFLNKNNIVFEKNNRYILNGKELDIYIPDYNVAIEYNGTYWHSSLYKDKNYHYNKSKLCEEKGIRLIHIWEYEWENERQRPILENIILSACGKIQNKIYARNCKIEIRESKNMKQFFEENNIQGFRGGKFAICLIYNNKVVMSYIMGKAFFGKGKYEWEVIRGATKLGCSVIGGASKIWKYFKNNYNPQSCVYYVDYNYFNGQSIQYLDNFKFIKTQPSFKNWWRIENKIKNRDPLHHKEIKELEKEGLVIPIYNAGTKVYVWEKD